MPVFLIRVSVILITFFIAFVKQLYVLYILLNVVRETCYSSVMGQYDVIRLVKEKNTTRKTQERLKRRV
jgi:hypothetical protein